MANPANPFSPNHRIDRLVRQVRPWSDDVVDKLGSDCEQPAVSNRLGRQHFLGNMI